MRKLLILMTMFITLFLASIAAYAFEVEPQFEDYNWGSSLDEVKEIVTSKGHRMLLQDPGIMYLDRILDKEVKIMFFFTPKTQKLHSIYFIWSTTSIGSSLLKELTEEYGEPSRPNQSIKEYWWGSSIRVEFEFSKTELLYCSNKYMNIFRKERSEIEDAKTKDKP